MIMNSREKDKFPHNCVVPSVHLSEEVIFEQ